MNRYKGLDTLRFFAALWVMMRHCVMPPFTSGAAEEDLPQAVDLIWRGSISGPAAVLVFFVISGFCIHLPYARGKAFDLGEYSLRRFVRLLLPLIGALVLWRLYHGMGDFSKDWLGGIPAWSIVAELIYYCLYPLMRLVKGKGWWWLFGISFAAALAMAVFTQPVNNINYPAWGYRLDWVMGLPVWLMGVLLAESKLELPSPSARRIRIERFVAFALGSLTTWLAWQRLAGHHLTLNFVAIYAVWWIRDELGWYRSHEPVAWLEKAGAWGYSIYLVHMLGHNIYQGLHIPYFGDMADWMIKITFLLGLCYAFHRVIERPSHQLAQWLARRWLQRTA